MCSFNRFASVLDIEPQNCWAQPNNAQPLSQTKFIHMVLGEIVSLKIVGINPLMHQLLSQVRYSFIIIERVIQIMEAERPNDSNFYNFWIDFPENR